MVGPSGLEPPIKNLSLRYAPRKAALAFLSGSFELTIKFNLYGFEPTKFCGRTKWTRTTDLVLIRHAL